jgi:ParB-like chromosome segregation protein Spo0J
VVYPDGDGRFVLVAGERRLRMAAEAGEDVVECTVREDLTSQEKWELQLAERYHSALTPPMALGREFMKYRDAYNVTQQELARRTGITPGTIHHYESLIRTLDPWLGEKVDRGELTFKEARSIADIAGHQRQREIAQPFLSGRLSSVHVERIVGKAKNHAELSIDQIIDEVLNGGETAAPEPSKPEPASASLPPAPTAETMENVVLRLAGELDALQLQTVPEYRRLKLISSLRILDSRLKSALAFLNGGPARESEVPRPMSGTIQPFNGRTGAASHK